MLDSSIACQSRRCVRSLSSEAERSLYIPLVWKRAYKELELADFNDRICVIEFVLLVGEKPIPDALYNGAAEAD
jgi:hypothetical protein